MDNKLRFGILAIVVLVVAGIIGYKFTGQDVANTSKNKPTKAVLDCVYDDSKETADKSANISKEQLRSVSSKLNSSTEQKKESKPAESSSVVKNEDKVEPKVTEIKKQSSALPAWMLFRSTTCMPCIEMQKIMDNLEPEYAGKVQFVPVDVNDPASEALVRQYDIRYIPTTFLLDRNRKITYQNVGVISIVDMRAKLNSLVETK